MPDLLVGYKNIYYQLGNNLDLDNILLSVYKKLQTGQGNNKKNVPEAIFSMEKVLHELRLIKDKTEINLIKKAVDISIKAHTEAMQTIKNYEYEYQVSSIFDSIFSYYNCQHAYSPIVASGKNACILHYSNNQDKLAKKGIILIDAGCEYKGYASDITRSFPVSGKFNSYQKEIYNLVLFSQQKAIATIKPDVSINKPHLVVIDTLTQGLIDLGLLKGSLSENIEKENYKKFYMHGTGHFIGLDVHDVGRYKLYGKWRKFKTNMLTTIEPGIYIRPCKSIDKKWWNIGIRIEDDILLTSKGYENLSKNLANTIYDIEYLMAQ